MTVDGEMSRGNDRLTSGTRLRLMSPLGHYWRSSLTTETALYSASPDIVFTACHFDEALHHGEYYSEFDDPCLEEVRLLAALALPVGWEGGAVCLYPSEYEIVIPECPDLESPTVAARLRSHLMDSLPTTEERAHVQSGHLAGNYDFRDAAAPLAVQKRLFDAIPIHDHLLLRGLSAWVKAVMLRVHRQFALEALYSMFVSLDASMSLIFRELERQGVRNPTALDAGAFLDQMQELEPQGVPYFADFYLDRIQLLHPNSRFGTMPYPPSSMGDLYHLEKALREVYRMLIIGDLHLPTS